MSDIIHRSSTSELQVTTLILSNRSGDGSCTISSPSGFPFQFLGMRCGIENHTEPYTIPQEKSGYSWTNTGSTSGIIFTLPSGALDGTTASFIRTGDQISINPNTAGQIYIADSGYFRPAGEAAILASSGAGISLVCDGGNRWYPLYQMGTIQ